VTEGCWRGGGGVAAPAVAGGVAAPAVAAGLGRGAARGRLGRRRWPRGWRRAMAGGVAAGGSGRDGGGRWPKVAARASFPATAAIGKAPPRARRRQKRLSAREEEGALYTPHPLVPVGGSNRD
jgi:hypothetical protein